MTQEMLATPVRIEAGEKGQVSLRTLGRSNAQTRAVGPWTAKHLWPCPRRRGPGLAPALRRPGRRGTAARLAAGSGPVAHGRDASRGRASARRLRASFPPVLRNQLTAYLARLRGHPAISASSLRPGRPACAGRSPLRTACDLLPLLPPRPALYRPGDRPDGLEQWRLVDLLALGEVRQMLESGASTRRGLTGSPQVLAREPGPQRALLPRRHQGDPGPGRGADAGRCLLARSYPDRNPVCLKVELVEGGNLAGLVRKWARARIDRALRADGPAHARAGPGGRLGTWTPGHRWSMAI